MNINGYEVSDGVLDLSGSDVTVIEDKKFWACKAIREVILPAGTEYIGNWAFAKCSNLVRVSVARDFRPGMFGRDVFKDCAALKEIMFADSTDETGKLLALCANRLPYDHLLRADDIGQKSWYEKWDIGLTARLKKDDAEARMSAALCGEEDISYDGIGSVDGEMPGETGDFIQKEEYDKCSLCYIRLSNDTYLSDHTRKIISDYITDNRFGEGEGSSFNSIFEESDSDLKYLRIYLDIVKPDAKTLSDMISALPSRHVRAKSFLIEESSGSRGSLDDLLL